MDMFGAGMFVWVLMILCKITFLRCRLIWMMKRTCLFGWGLIQAFFSVRNAWNMMRKNRKENHLLDKLWYKALPFKMPFISWRILLSKIPTDDSVSRFSNTGRFRCHCCRAPQPESIHHVFVNGYFAKSVWKHFRDFFGISGKFHSVQHALTSWWNFASCNPASAFLTKNIPIIIIWELWKARCSSRYGNRKPFLPILLFQIS